MNKNDYKEKYFDLIMSVERKFEGESRHETAKKYIKYMEQPAYTAAKSTEKVSFIKRFINSFRC